MSLFLRTTTFPPIAQILAVPQVVVIDDTGPNIRFGNASAAACLVGEFTGGPFIPTEVGSPGELTATYSGDGKIWPYFSQDAAGVQNGSRASYNGNGMLALLKKSFRRLIIQRVDTEAVTTDGGTTKAILQITVTVAAVDQDGSGNTNKDIIVPAGARFGDNAVFGTATRVFALSGSVTIPKGTALTTNATTISAPCFPVKVIEPVVATTAAAINSVIDAVLPGVAAGTTITAVTNATSLWPSGTGTTLATRIEGQYVVAIGGTLPVLSPADAITVIWAARRTVIIRQAIATNCKDSSDAGRGRVGPVAAEPATAGTIAGAIAAKAAAIALAGSDGYVQPADRPIICFPASKIQVPDFGNIKVVVNSDSWMASTLSNFPEEKNPGARNDFIQGIVEPEDAFIASPLLRQDYANLQAAGICALYRDKKVGWQFMQGVTAANSISFPTRTPIKRRRMADLIQDELNDIAAPYLKEPATTDRVIAYNAEINAFLDGLLSPDLPPAQRIKAYLVDPISGNTAVLNALGIFVTNIYVTLLPSMDQLVFYTQIGETVTIPVTLAVAA